MKSLLALALLSLLAGCGSGELKLTNKDSRTEDSPYPEGINVGVANAGPVLGDCAQAAATAHDKMKASLGIDLPYHCESNGRWQYLVAPQESVPDGIWQISRDLGQYGSLAECLAALPAKTAAEEAKAKVSLQLVFCSPALGPDEPQFHGYGVSLSPSEPADYGTEE